MTAYEYLSRPEALKQQIRADLRKIEYWREKSYGVSGMQYDGMPHNPSIPADAPFVNCLEKVFALKADVENKNSELEKALEEVGTRISLLISPEERLVLCRRYPDGSDFAEIGELTGLPEYEVHKIHKNALQHFPVPERDAAGDSDV